MKASTRDALTSRAIFIAIFLSKGCRAQLLYGVGLPGFKTVSVPQGQIATAEPTGQAAVQSTAQAGAVSVLPFKQVPLAAGLTLQGTTAYTKGSPVPSGDCLTTSLKLFTDCQPFLQALINNGGQLNSITILQILVLAQNKTSSSQCVAATLNYLNQGCVCDLTTYNTLQALPTSTVPQLVKITANLLAQKMCPAGLISPGPPPAPDQMQSMGSVQNTPAVGGAGTTPILAG